MNGYFDSAASMPVFPQALLKTLAKMRPGNPSSAHVLGNQARTIINNTRLQIADYVGCDSDQIYFTSGATEAANVLIQGYIAYLMRQSSARNEIIVSAIEHPAVFQTVYAMQNQGFVVRQIPCNKQGEILPESIEQLINARTAMVCVMAVNNETGAIQPVNDIAKLVKKIDSDVLFMCDAVQQFAKLDTKLDLQVIDAFFMSGHKIGADKGVGCFYLNDRFPILPLMHGGTQEQAYRPGTENVFGIALLGEALAENLRGRDSKIRQTRQLARHLIDRLKMLQVNHVRLVPEEKSSPFILSLAFPGVSSSSMMRDLATSGFYISQGSACSSHSMAPSRILSAMSLSDEIITSTIRISFSHSNTQEEVEQLAEQLAACCKLEVEI